MFLRARGNDLEVLMVIGREPNPPRGGATLRTPEKVRRGQLVCSGGRKCSIGPFSRHLYVEHIDLPTLFLLQFDLVTPSQTTAVGAMSLVEAARGAAAATMKSAAARGVAAKIDPGVKRPPGLAETKRGCRAVGLHLASRRIQRGEKTAGIGTFGFNRTIAYEVVVHYSYGTSYHRERREDRSQLQSSRGHSRDRRGGSADRRHKSLDRQERGGRGSLDRQERDRGGSRERLDRGGDRGSLERQDRISARTSLERGLDRRSAERGDSFGGQSSRTLLPPQEHRDGSGEKSSSMLSSQMTVRDRERGYEDRGRDYEFGRSSDLRRDGGPSDRQQARFDDPHGSHREQGQSSGRGRESWGGDDFDRRGSHSGRYERTGPRSKDGAVDWGTGGSDYPPDWGSSGQHYRRERSGSERSGRGFGRGAHLTGSNSVRIEQRDQFEWRGGLGGGRRTPPQFRIGGLGGYSPQLPPRRRSRSGERLLPPEALQRGGPPPPSMSGGDRRSSRERSPRRVDQQLPERLPREKQQQGPLVAKGDDEISKDEGNVTDREKEMTSKTAKEEGEVTDEQQQTTSEAVGQQNLPHKRTKLDEVDANKGEKKENGEAKEEGEEDDDEGEEQPIAGDQFSDIESDEELKEPTATAASTTTAPAVAGGADSAGAEPEEGETVSRPQSRRSSNQDSAENKVGEKEGEKGDLLEGISDEDLDVSDEDEGRMSMEKKMVDALEVSEKCCTTFIPDVYSFKYLNLAGRLEPADGEA